MARRFRRTETAPTVEHSARPRDSRLVPPRDELEEWSDIGREDGEHHRRSSRSLTGRAGRRDADHSGPGGPADVLTPNPGTAALPCAACGSPRLPGERFCTACGTPASPAAADPSLPASAGAAEPGRQAADAPGLDQPHTAFHCQNCGADIATSAGQRAYRCPFCDSTYVAEIQATGEGRRRPEFIIGFAVTTEEATRKFSEWIGRGGWFRPSDLPLRAMSEKQMGVYVPFWHYAYAASSRWQAMIGQYWYRTETYMVRNSQGKMEMRTRRVRETEWNPLSGRHRRYYFGYLVSASKGLTHEEALTIQPYDLRALQRFAPYFLAGWMSEEYTLDYAAASQIAEEEFRRREENNIAQMMPGDTYRGLQVETEFEMHETDLVLLPVHILSYRYRDRVYRFLVNGQTGKAAGSKPVSAVRVAIAVAVGLILIAIAALIIAAIGGGGR